MEEIVKDVVRNDFKKKTWFEINSRKKIHEEDVIRNKLSYAFYDE